MHEKRMNHIKKQIKENSEFQSLEVDDNNFVLPEKKTLAIRGLGYWIGSLQWDKTNESMSDTVISGKLSKYWLAAPIAIIGLAIALWFFKDFVGFLQPIADNSLIYVGSVVLITVLIGILNYFIHYVSVKSILEQLTIFLKYNEISYEFGNDLFDAEKAREEAKLEFEKSLLDAEVSEAKEEKPLVDTMDALTTDYVPETIDEDHATEILIQPKLDDEESYHVDFDEEVGEEITEEYDAQSAERKQLVEGESVEEVFEDADEEELEPWTGSVSSYEEPSLMMEIEDVVEDEEVFVSAKDFSDSDAEKVKLMDDGIDQTLEMKEIGEFDSEIEGGIQFGGDSAFQVGARDDSDDDALESFDAGDAEATKIDDELISPDDAFAQGFSPQIMSDDELAMPELAEDEEISIDEDFEVPEISEEYEEEVEDDYFVPDAIEDFEETEIDVSEALDDELIDDDYTIEVVEEVEDTGFGQEFEETNFGEIETVEEEASEDSEIVEFTDSEYTEPFTRPITDMDELEVTDDFDVPDIASEYVSPETMDDFTESDIPDGLMDSEITQDMGIADADIKFPGDEIETDDAEDIESEIFEIPDITEEEDETELPDDFNTPIIEEEDGFEDATEYVVQQSDDANVTSIDSYEESTLNDDEIEETQETENDKDTIIEEDLDGPTEISSVEEIIGDDVEIFDAEQAFAGDTEFFDDVEEIVNFEDDEAEDEDNIEDPAEEDNDWEKEW
ncbi:MAG: hypothetical protein K8S87_12390 [Planctomycetes bacterium]|nr:hypothetical protein [Planctomycetota bacterium]